MKARVVATGETTLILSSSSKTFKSVLYQRQTSERHADPMSDVSRSLLNSHKYENDDLRATSESGVSLQVNSGIDNEVVETIRKDFLSLSDSFRISIVVSHVESNEMKFAGETLCSKCFETFSGRVPGRSDDNVAFVRELTRKQ